MSTLSDIRQQYPQYNAMSDQTLSDALYSKFYDGKISREDFDSKIGIESPAGSGPAAVVAPEQTDAELPGVHFGGSTVASSEIPPGPSWEEAQQKLIALEKQGVPKTDPRYQQATREKALGLDRLSTGGLALGGARGAGPALERGASAVGSAIGDTAMARGVGRILPGASAKAESAIKNIGTPTGKFDPLGSDILQGTVGKEYGPLYDQRASALSRAAHISDEAERTKSFRNIYNDAKYAKLREFENTPLGKKLTATTGRFSEITRADPAKVPNMVFDTPQSVRDFRQLVNGDQTQVEQYARQYAVESINKIIPNKSLEANPFGMGTIGKAAEAVEKWMKSPQQEWLSEVPETKKSVEQFEEGLRDTAKAQRALRIGAFGLAGFGLFEEGFHPWGWVKSFVGGM
jgi:hypothetical protein